MIQGALKANSGGLALQHARVPSVPFPLNANLLPGVASKEDICNEWFLFAADTDPVRVSVGNLWPGHNTTLADTARGALAHNAGLLGRIPQRSCSLLLKLLGQERPTAPVPAPGGAGGGRNASESIRRPQVPAVRVDISVPYFEDRESEEDILRELFENLSALSTMPIHAVDSVGSQSIPDGFVAFHELETGSSGNGISSPSGQVAIPPKPVRLSYTMGVNDAPFVAYHRANNFSRVDLGSLGGLEEIAPDLGGSLVIKTEAQLALMDLLHAAFRQQVLAGAIFWGALRHSSTCLIIALPE